MKKASKTPPVPKEYEAINKAVALADDESAPEHIRTLAAGLKAVNELLHAVKLEKHKKT